MYNNNNNSNNNNDTGTNTANSNNNTAAAAASAAVVVQQQQQQNKQRGRRKKIRTEPIRPLCPQCNKQFSNQSALTKHKLTHSDERRFVCKQCSKAFKRHDHLTGHMLTHSNRKPFECNVEGCDKTYCDARSLRRHKEHHHNIITIRAPQPNQPPEQSSTHQQVYNPAQTASTSSYDDNNNNNYGLVNDHVGNQHDSSSFDNSNCHTYYDNNNIEGPCISDGTAATSTISDEQHNIIHDDSQQNQVSCNSFRPTLPRDPHSNLNMNCSSYNPHHHHHQAVTYQSYHESLPNTPILSTNATPYSNFFQSSDCVSTSVTAQNQGQQQQYDCVQDHHTSLQNQHIASPADHHISDHELQNAVNQQFQMHHISNNIRQPSISLPATPTDQNQHFTFPSGLHMRPRLPAFGTYHNPNGHLRMGNNINQGHDHNFAYHHHHQRHSEEVYGSQVSLDDYSSSTATSNHHYSTSSRVEDDYNPNDDLLNHNSYINDGSNQTNVVLLANPGGNHADSGKFKTMINNSSCNSYNHAPQISRQKIGGVKQMPPAQFGFNLEEELEDDVFSESDTHNINSTTANVGGVAAPAPPTVTNNNQGICCDINNNYNNNNETTGGKICTDLANMKM